MEDQRHRQPRVDLRTLRRARDLRHNMTQPEKALWYRLRRRQLKGFRFRRQHPVGPFIVDFCCPEMGLAIEVDGESHVGRGEEDGRRTLLLESHGLTVIRVTNDDVLRHLDDVIEFIARTLDDLVDRQAE